jgi:hypothetical protein
VRSVLGQAVWRLGELAEGAAGAGADAREIGSVDVDRDHRRVGNVAHAVDVARRRETADVADLVLIGGEMDDSFATGGSGAATSASPVRPACGKLVFRGGRSAHSGISPRGWWTPASA